MSKRNSPKAKHGGPKPVQKSYGTPRRANANLNRNGASRAQVINPNKNDADFSLQDEARMTGGRSAFWNIDTKLRTRGVNFVSAGLHSTMEEEDKSDPALQAPSTSKERPVLPGEFHPPREDKPGSPSVKTENSDLFIIDTTGDAKYRTNIPNVIARSPSPTNSEISEEIVFTGRDAQPTVIEEPIISNKHVLTSSATEPQSMVAKQSWDDTQVEWVHRAKPGVGWTVPKARKPLSDAAPMVGFRVKKMAPTADDAADDYIDNIKQHGFDSSNATAAFSRRNIDLDLGETGYVRQQFDSLSIEYSKSNANATPRTRSRGPASDYQSSISNEERSNSKEVRESVDDEESDSLDDEDDEADEDIGSDFDFDDNDIAGGFDDAAIATLLAKQEELGMGGDELLLFSEATDASVRKAAKRYASENPKKSGRGKSKQSFPSATLFADVLDEDPYNGFDVMDYERPSLRKKKGKGKALPFELSDEELQASIQTSWENDRKRKISRKAEREELRAQGLLGKKSSVESKYGEGMTIWQIKAELEAFLESDAQQKALPPMDKRRRKMVHEIAAEFKLKTKSMGSGSFRFPQLFKTKNTIGFNEHKFVQRARKINMGFFPRSDAQGVRSLRTNNRSGNAMGVRYKDGDVVGATAPEIGADNRGRALLEKMGWSEGMALGALDNKGILQPITGVVKNSKSGLG